jgi:hypothetical protein
MRHSQVSRESLAAHLGLSEVVELVATSAFVIVFAIVSPDARANRGGHCDASRGQRPSTENAKSTSRALPPSTPRYPDMTNSIPLAIVPELTSIA